MSTKTRAFTLLELLVSVGIIVLLASITLVGLRGVRASANRANSTNALRMIMRGYAGYSVDSNQQLMPGYMSTEALILLGITANAPDGEPLDDPTKTRPDPNDASSYVWRLSPYLDNEWKTLFIDYRSNELLAHLSGEILGSIYGPGSADAGNGELGVGLIPAFGLNSIYVGGDDVHGDGDITSRNPWNPTVPSDILAATRLSEVKNPAKLIVFAPTVHWGEVVDPRSPLLTDPPMTSLAFGYSELRPPFILLDRDNPDSDNRQQWHMERTFTKLDGDFNADDGEGRPIGGGVPVARWGKDLIPTGRLDGSVITDDLQQLAQDAERRNWSPHATGLFSN